MMENLVRTRSANLLLKDSVKLEELTPENIKDFDFSVYNYIIDAIDSIKYSANEIPSLPTPQKLGYSFLGWYLDKAYTIPYVKDILYLYMEDITLYAKFEKINYSINGIYDISYNINSDINDDSLNICDYDRFLYECVVVR